MRAKDHQPLPHPSQGRKMTHQPATPALDLSDLDAFEGHTPGPFTFDGKYIYDANERPIARLHPNGAIAPLVLRNTIRLIAAAPSLLSLARSQREELTSTQHTLGAQNEKVAKQRAELVRARGRIAELCEALEFYSNYGDWPHEDAREENAIMLDRGEQARAALASIKGA